MQVAAFFHVWAEGEWQAPVRDYLDALDASGFDGPLFLGLVGRPTKQLEVEGHIKTRRDFTLAASVTEGFESVTIEALRRYACSHPGAIVYAHSKGAATVSEFRDRWRMSMLNRVVRPLYWNLELLERGYNTVGCHWLTEEQFPGMFGPMTEPAWGSGFYGGNFWIASCNYLRRLPQCPPEPRWKAESWIGWGDARPYDLLPGWPHDRRWPELCA